ncbi:MAG: hypothetical protein EP329_11160 [Deltaproteobacteria bacterium]|nr:MAG: hypothetical protein EP329_11160 [Deltaproteobacteria bacterium]
MAFSKPHWRRRLATLVGPIDRLWPPAVAGSAEVGEAFAAQARRLTSVHLQISALVVAGLSLLAWPTDALIFTSGSPEAGAVLFWRFALLVVCGGSYAVLRLTSRVSPAAVGMVAYAVIMAASGWLMSRAGGIESPLFYGIYTAPLLTVMLVAGLRVRILATAVLIVAYLAAFFATDPRHLAHPHVGTPLVWLSASAVTAVVVGHVVTVLLRANFYQRRALDRRARELEALGAQLEERVAEQAFALRALATDSARVQEQERLRLSVELHDELGQLLTGLQMELGWLRRRVEADCVAGLVEGVERADRLLVTVNDSVDALVSSLRPLALVDGGLYAALERLAREVETRFGVTCALHRELDEERLDEAGTIGAFRIVQEALTNVGRHAAAKQVDVHVVPAGDRCVVRVVDDGVGFDVGAPPPAGHFGLVGMRDRARILGGELRIQSVVGEGTALEVSFPLLTA